MKKLAKIASYACMALAASACSSNVANDQLASGLNPEDFKSTIDKKETALYTLKNKSGMEVSITNFGGRIVSIMVPDRNDSLRDVVLGFDKVSTYADIENSPSDFGAAIGRYANRINKGKFSVGGKDYQLPTNNFGHCLHGGPKGWQYQVYNAELLNDSTLKLTIESPDGDNSFPGNVTASVTYTLTSDNAIDIQYEATTDRETIINMTNHSYFNLSGDPTQKITNDSLYVNSTSFTPVDSTYMTTGDIVPVKDTPFDFSIMKLVGQDIDADNEQIKNGNGYDHNWVLDNERNIDVVSAILKCPASGIQLEVFTDEPGIQVYSGNFLDGKSVGKKGIAYQQRVGICLETQKYPDTPNKPQWPSAILKPGETYKSHTIFKFSKF